MSAADHYAQAEEFLTEANQADRGDHNYFLMAAAAHALLAIGGFIVQFSQAGAVVLSEDAQAAQRVVEE